MIKSDSSSFKHNPAIRRAVVADAAILRLLIVDSVSPETNPDFNQQGITTFYKPKNQKRMLRKPLRSKKSYSRR